MTKELTHRADELEALGWLKSDVFRYVELWDYRQRWGAINLEREDRLFLRKAETALPQIKSHKASVKKPIREKSYYCRILFFIDQMNQAEESFGISGKAKGLWPILLEEELRAIDYFQPILGLPDTLKAKSLIPFREEMISSLQEKYHDHIQLFDYDFNSSLASYNSSEKKNWQPLREAISDENRIYPVIVDEFINPCLMEVRKQIIPMIRSTFPSLSEFDKSNPSDEWIPDSDS